MVSDSYGARTPAGRMARERHTVIDCKGCANCEGYSIKNEIIKKKSTQIRTTQTPPAYTTPPFPTLSYPPPTSPTSAYITPPSPTWLEILSVKYSIEGGKVPDFASIKDLFSVEFNSDFWNR